MSSSEERVFVIGATGDIGGGVVRGLVKKGVNTTAYVRNETKANELFKEELASGLLKLSIGDYTTVDVYTNAIKGHNRLFILLLGDYKQPALITQVKGSFSKIAYEQGVRQIVDLSSGSVRTSGNQGIIGYWHTAPEAKLWALVDEKPEERSLVVLRPWFFMTNHFMGDVHNIKRANKIISCGPPTAGYSWIDTRDIAEVAVVVLTEPIEKHDHCTYEMGSEVVSNEQRAALFTKVLGRPITYQQVPPADLYKVITSHGMPHSLTYDLVTYAINDRDQNVTPQLSIFLNRPLRTLEEWIKDNAQAFQN